MMKERKFLRLFVRFVFILFLIQSCTPDKGKYDIEEIVLDNGKTIINISKDDHFKCSVEVDENGILKQVSDKKTDVIYHKGLVYQVNNKNSINDSTLITLGYQDVDIMVDRYRDKIKSRTIVNDILFSPVISHYVARFENKNWFLSENKTFDFRTALMEKEDLEYVVLRENLKDLSFDKGKSIRLNFEIYSQNAENKLLKGKFDNNFNALTRVDTISIDETFSFEFTPVSKYDTIRFIIYSSFQEMSKSFYYELPIITK